MKHKLSNILYTNDYNRVNNKFQYNYHTLYENYVDELIESYSNNNYYQPLFFQNFSLDIVTESVFDYPQPYLTEKIFKSVSTKRLFIFVGPAYTLKFLKNLGFKTFSSYINEEYDLIEDPAKRMSAIETEIQNYVTKSLVEIQKILEDATPILEHNFSVLQSLYDKELERVIEQLESQHV